MPASIACLAQSLVPLLLKMNGWTAMQRSAPTRTIAAFRIGPCPLPQPLPVLVRDGTGRLSRDAQPLASSGERLVNARGAAVDDHDIQPMALHQTADDFRGELMAVPEAIASDEDSHV